MKIMRFIILILHLLAFISYVIASFLFANNYILNAEYLIVITSLVVIIIFGIDVINKLTKGNICNVSLAIVINMSIMFMYFLIYYLTGLYSSLIIFKVFFSLFQLLNVVFYINYKK